MRGHDPRSSVHDEAAEIVALYGMGLLMGLVVEADTAWTWTLPGLGLLWLLLAGREPPPRLAVRRRDTGVRAARLRNHGRSRPRPERAARPANAPPSRPHRVGVREEPCAS